MPIASPARMTVTRLPDLVRRDGFVVIGLSRRFDDASKSEIPQLWPQLFGALPFPGQIDSPAAYGIVLDADRHAGRFRYMAAVEVAPDAVPPATFERLGIAPAVYAVFRIALDGGAIHGQIKAAMAEIWGRMLPAAGLALAVAPAFERYDRTRPLTEPGATVDVHVPVLA